MGDYHAVHWFPRNKVSCKRLPPRPTHPSNSFAASRLHRTVSPLAPRSSRFAQPIVIIEIVIFFLQIIVLFEHSNNAFYSSSPTRVPLNETFLSFQTVYLSHTPFADTDAFGTIECRGRVQIEIFSNNSKCHFTLRTVTAH